MPRALLFHPIRSCWPFAQTFINNRTMNARLSCTLLLLSLTVRGAVAGGETSLWPLQKTLAEKKFVDLTHDFAPGIPHWPGFPDETTRTIYWYDKLPDTMGNGFYS